jgi:hypothetical protein
MGTAITLEVGSLELTYCKNDRGIDHGSLFQTGDRQPVHSQQVDYDYFSKSGEDPTSMEMAFLRSLKEVVPRLELLGFNLDRAHQEYVQVSNRWREQISDGDSDASATLMSFAEFCEFATTHPLRSLDSTYVEGFDETSQRRIRGRFDSIEVDRIPNYLPHANHAFSERTFLLDSWTLCIPIPFCESSVKEGPTNRNRLYGSMVLLWTLAGQLRRTSAPVPDEMKPFSSQLKEVRTFTF